MGNILQIAKGLMADRTKKKDSGLGRTISDKRKEETNACFYL
jgi:hypothetical protein